MRIRLIPTNSITLSSGESTVTSMWKHVTPSLSPLLVLDSKGRALNCPVRQVGLLTTPVISTYDEEGRRGLQGFQGLGKGNTRSPSTSHSLNPEFTPSTPTPWSLSLTFNREGSRKVHTGEVETDVRETLRNTGRPRETEPGYTNTTQYNASVRNTTPTRP